MKTSAPSARRTVLALAGAAFAHLGLLAGGFWLASHEPVAPEPRVVTVLTGHVEADTGDFRADGMREAKIAQR